MNRIRFGAVLLIVLLIAGLWVAGNMTRWSEEIAGQLDISARQAFEEDFSSAVRTAGLAERQWQARWGINAAIADHAPLEQVDVGFAQLHIYADCGDRLSFAALCAQLAQQIRAIGEGAGAGWKNIL